MGKTKTMGLHLPALRANYQALRYAARLDVAVTISSTASLTGAQRPSCQTSYNSGNVIMSLKRRPPAQHSGPIFDVAYCMLA